MKKEKIFVHIGMSKTGTSRIQKFLFENEKLLSINGFYYPKVGIYSDKSHNELSFAISSSPIKSYSLVDKIKLIDSLFNEIAACQSDKIILSSDRFSCLLDDEYFRNKFSIFNFYLIAYIRQPEEYIESWYKQWLKAPQMSMDLTFDDFFEKYYRSFSMKKRITPWLKYLKDEEICLSSFEKVRDEGGILLDFLMTLGVNYSQSSKDVAGNSERINVGLGYMSSKIMRVVNEFGDFPERNNFLLLCKSLEDTGKFKGKKLISSEQSIIIKEQYSLENQRLLEKYNRSKFVIALK
jgi:hypothetical protein